ncbi:MAG: hypothetical protein ACKPKO_46265, partial [Candidatus Fonsibacter sp.]
TPLTLWPEALYYICKPWTLLRQNSGGAARTCAPHDHPCFHTLTDDWHAYLREKQLASFFVEEVETLLRLDPQTGQPYLKAIVPAVSQKGYIVRVVQYDHANASTSGVPVFS